MVDGVLYHEKRNSPWLVRGDDDDGGGGGGGDGDDDK